MAGLRTRNDVSSAPRHGRHLVCTLSTGHHNHVKIKGAIYSYVSVRTRSWSSWRFMVISSPHGCGLVVGRHERWDCLLLTPVRITRWKYEGGKSQPIPILWKIATKYVWFQNLSRGKGPRKKERRVELTMREITIPN